MDVRQQRTSKTVQLVGELNSCVKVEVVVPGSLSQIVLMISVDVKQDLKKLSVSKLKSCVKVEVAVLGPPPLIVPTDSVDVKQH